MPIKWIEDRIERRKHSTFKIAKQKKEQTILAQRMRKRMEAMSIYAITQFSEYIKLSMSGFVYVVGVGQK